MDIWRSAAGVLQIEITSADNMTLLQSLAVHGIAVRNITEVDGLTVRVEIERKDFISTERIVRKYDAEMKIMQKHGVFWNFTALLRRPVLLMGGILLLLFVLFIPGRVFFVHVEGNYQIPSKQILEKAESCGICFGASRKEIRSEKVKNALLCAIPELQWAGVNTNGCVATICVREKTPLEQEKETDGTVGSIVAVRDGVIVSATVLSGDLLCTTGEAVKAGQTLVSGYTDCGLTVQATRAEAEILAQTSRTLQVVTPTQKQKREEQTGTQVRYGLLLGKKLIKFYKDSGISDATCVKMYSEEYVTLPGDFRLPVAIVKEEVHFYEIVSNSVEEARWLPEAAREYLLKQMAAGQILSALTETDRNPDTCVLSGKYACLEMIGQVKHEELIYGYGEDH